MQIPTIAEQTLAELPLLGETRGFVANDNFLFALLGFSLVVAISILAATIRVRDTITKKKNYFFIMGYRRSYGYFFLLGA